jgi:hypothetical protein
MSVTYFAYLCYPPSEDKEDNEPEIKFRPPEKWEYEKILPIQFSILHGWTYKDKELYNGYESIETQYNVDWKVA